jgi:uncharacterized membrane protein YfcA
MAAASLLLLLLPEPGCAEKQGNPHPTRYPTAVSLGSGVGFLAGIIGQGGAFIILPLMIHVLKVPLRTAIGTTTAVAFLSALAGFLGKWSTGQVPLLWGIAVATGALIGGQFGGMLSQRLSTVLLQRILLFTVAVSAVLICLQVLK